MTNPLDRFFELGNKATKGDPEKKALFDYTLYWIVFLAFISIALNDYYQFFFKNAGINLLFWGVILSIFGWFNYYALGAFRNVYKNMKKLRNIDVSQKSNGESGELKEMLGEFKDEKGNVRRI